MAEGPSAIEAGPTIAQPVALDSPRSSYARVAAALGHPLRVRVLVAMRNRRASPSELAATFGEPVGVVSYHVRRLEQIGYLELLDRTEVRGATRHTYGLVPVALQECALVLDRLTEGESAAPV